MTIPKVVNGSAMSVQQVGELVSDIQFIALKKGLAGLSVPIQPRNDFVSQVALASKKLPLTKAALSTMAKKPRLSLNDIYAIFAVNFSFISNLFHSDLKTTFLIKEQKLLLATIAAFSQPFLLASAENIQRLFENISNKLNFSESFSTVVNGLNVFDDRNNVDNALWEAAGQLTSIIPLVMRTTRAVSSALAGLGVGLVVIEGALLQHQIDAKHAEILDKTAKFESLAFLRASNGANADIELDGQVYTQNDIQALEADLKQRQLALEDLMFRRQFVIASFVFAVAAVALATAFTGGAAPLAIGIAAACVSLSLTIAESCLVAGKSIKKPADEQEEVSETSFKEEGIEDNTRLLDASKSP